MSHVFRELLKKVGSGNHTSEPLSREEAARATRMMLQQEATPAQIGAFMIAHRIKRPVPSELVGMLDAYAQIGPIVPAIQADYPVTILCSPYDGRSRTAPINPLTALILAAAGVPTLMHGGDRMPTKEGLPLIEIWQALGVPFHCLSLTQVHTALQTTGLGFVYLPNHFPEAQALIPYREQIGKRPPFATIELMWLPYAGQSHAVTGFVHPPTEEFARQTYGQRQQPLFTTVKGLEGSCDLPRSRTAIIAMGNPGQADLERLLLHPRDYGFGGDDVPMLATPDLVREMQAVLAGESGELAQSTVWNGGFYLWRCGVCESLEAGFDRVHTLLSTGVVQQKLAEVQRAIATLALVPLA